ncbi:hypothetical protein B0H19DRAFT_1080060 [Mycena capillaripes]|nr:hypothetical protein B0H19DRAFT_1080060 [Mycena capillaripes]
MSKPPPARRTRVFLACLNCRKRKIKCLTVDSEEKPCGRCVRKGLLCEYRTIAEEQEQSANAGATDSYGRQPAPPTTQAAGSCSFGNQLCTARDLGARTARLHPLHNIPVIQDIQLVTSILLTGQDSLPRRVDHTGPRLDFARVFDRRLMHRKFVSETEPPAELSSKFSDTTRKLWNAQLPEKSEVLPRKQGKPKKGPRPTN